MNNDQQTRNIVEGIKSSHYFAAIITPGFVTNPSCAFQIGTAILFNKPLALIVHNGVELPKALTRVAELVERVDVYKEEDMQRALNSIKNLMERLR